MIFEESKLRFTFDSSVWTKLIKFDEHADYRNVENCLKGEKITCSNETFRINGTEAVDFIGITRQKQLFFVEVKSFLAHRIENKEKLKQAGEVLMTSVGRKVRDSIACIVAGKRNSTNDTACWDEVLSILENTEREVYVLLWLEEDCRHENEAKFAQNNYQIKLQSKLRWLTKTKNIRIYSSQTYENILGFTVERIPGGE